LFFIGLPERGGLLHMLNWLAIEVVEALALAVAARVCCSIQFVDFVDLNLKIQLFLFLDDGSACDVWCWYL
jgi:hypothetical protein